MSIIIAFHIDLAAFALQSSNLKCIVYITHSLTGFFDITSCNK